MARYHKKSLIYYCNWNATQTTPYVPILSIGSLADSFGICKACGVVNCYNKWTSERQQKKRTGRVCDDPWLTACQHRDVRTWAHHTALPTRIDERQPKTRYAIGCGLFLYFFLLMQVCLRQWLLCNQDLSASAKTRFLRSLWMCI
jgi:hypothetical protein